MRALYPYELWLGVSIDIQTTRHTLANAHLLSHILFIKMYCRFALQSYRSLPSMLGEN